MKKIIICIILILSSFFVFSQRGWSTLNLPEAARYDDIFFINENIGWAACSWPASEDGGRVYKTTDGGKTWIKTSLISNKYFRSIEFFDENIGICGSLNSIPPTQASLYRTTDGGLNWTDIAPGISPEIPGICGLATADENTIYGVGIWSEPAFLIKSIDKGVTWTYKDMSAYASSLIDVFFLDADHGFATGTKSEEEGGVILYTSDGGQNWEEKFLTHRAQERVWKIQTPDSVHFYGSIEGFVTEDSEGNPMPTHMLRSSDAGQTWEEKVVYNRYRFIQTIGFLNENLGWTGGHNTLFETQDGGDTWSMLSFGTQHNRFFKVNDHTAYLTGEKVYKFNSTITSTPDHGTYDPIHALDVSPNPSQRDITIKATLKIPTYAQISIYSLTGQRITKLFNGNTEAGEKKFTFDLTTMPSKSYLVILKTNEGLITKKVLKK